MTYAEELFSGKSVSLLGAGVSNMPLAAMAAPYAARLTVRDRKSPAELGENAEKLKSLGAVLITGEEYLSGIDEDLVFRSPGIRPDLPELNQARERGSRVVSEMELFLASCRCPVYAVTGSDGKTTTTTITSLLLDSPLLRGKVFLGGNIGEPLLHRIEKIGEGDVCAVELSSFQLMTVEAPAKVEAAAITNLSPNHLNWHTSMEEYVAAKAKLLPLCRRAVLNYDNPITRELAKTALPMGTPVTWFSLSPLPDGVLREGDSAVWLEPEDPLDPEDRGSGGRICTFFPEEGKREIVRRSEIKLPGLHNVANYMTAIGLTRGATTDERIREVCRTFGGVEHRLEFVREKDGVTYINGSIDSSPTRTAAALSALGKNRPVVLIAGGYDKHIPYGPLADAVFSDETDVRALVLTGDTARAIREAVESHPAWPAARENGFLLTGDEDFDAAVKKAAALARPGDTVLLSPASASFDHFKNFEERGKHFKELVKGL